MKSVTSNKVILGLLAVMCILFIGAGCKGTRNGALYPNNAASKSNGMKINPIDGAEMVWVPAGEFIMGSTDEQAAVELERIPQSARNIAKLILDTEKPQRNVYLDGYWMYKTEVTVAQYRRFCEATNREMPEAPEGGWKENHPIVNVAWQDAYCYSKWAGASLPTEAQWEKASRGADGRKFPWGNEWDTSKCANSLYGELENTVPVGSYASDVSPYGCLDMAGNVKEWCLDWYDPNYYKTAPARNPAGPPEAVQFETPIQNNMLGARVLRGGSGSYNLDYYFRCAFRGYTDPENYLSNFGFRCAQTE